MAQVSPIKDSICDALISMMEKQPFYKIKVIELIKVAGVSRSTFYIHFDSIYAVLQQIEDEFINGLPEERKISHGIAVEADILAGFEYIEGKLQVFKALCGPHGDPAFQARLANRSKRLLEKTLVSLPSKRTKAENSMIVEFLAGGQWNLYRWWAFHADEVSSEEVYQLTQEMVSMIHGLLKSNQVPIDLWATGPGR